MLDAGGEWIWLPNSLTFADIAFGDLRPSHVQSWVKAMQDKALEASTIRTRFNNVRSLSVRPCGPCMVRRHGERPRRVAGEGQRTTSGIEPRRKRGGCTSGESDVSSCRYGLCAFAGLRLGEARRCRSRTWTSSERDSRRARSSREGETSGDSQLKDGSNGTVDAPKG